MNFDADHQFAMLPEAARGAWRGNEFFLASRKWAAQWIWAGNTGPNQYVLFRKCFSLDVSQGAILHIAASSFYRLFLNDRIVLLEGGILSQPFHTFYDSLDLGPLLKKGENCIGVQVYFAGNRSYTIGGLLAELVDAQGKVLLRTDDGWTGLQAEAWLSDTLLTPGNLKAPYQEHFSAKLYPEGWSRADYSETGDWRGVNVLSFRKPTAAHLQPPFSRLIPREIPFMNIEGKRTERIECIEECLSLNARGRPGDASISLSQSGGPVRHARAQAVENLLRGEPAEFACSEEHLRSKAFDGRYDPCVTLDFGDIHTAYIDLDVEGEDGATIEIGYAERLVDGRFNIAIECSFASVLELRKGRQVFIPMHWRCFRYLRLRFRNTQGVLKVHGIRALCTKYPMRNLGRFSGDQELERVFEICRKTIHLCAHESIMDTPWRESAQWLGDVAAVSLGGIYACFGDATLAGKFLRQAGSNANPTGLLSNTSNVVNLDFRNSIPDYSLWWVIALWNHYQYTGESRWIRELYPQALRIIQTHLDSLNDQGLIKDMPYWVFIDWAHVRKDGACAAYNAIFAGALEAFGKLAGYVGDEYWRGRAALLRGHLKKAFQPVFWDAARGVLIDAVKDGRQVDAVSEHANLAAIRWGLVDAEATASIIDHFYDREDCPYVEAQPFFMCVVLPALKQARRMDLAIRLIRERWGERMVTKGNTTVNEEWGCNGSWRSGKYDGFLRSQSHAWSAYAAEFLVKELIGLEILEPGGSQISVEPWRAEFDYDVTYPLPNGHVRVTQKSGKHAIEAVGATIVETPSPST